ncbi:N-acetylmuramoyl-L-alanine amidase [Bacteroidia bacterium]|nr:N-acetylmuramoyl-L-alanine amidase [Bacteroidia bacterium]GHV70247.1 N-acetylmuramoyl-L-alanine amidase [Bacteroidia bacterium]
MIPLQAQADNESFVLVIDPGHGGKDPGAIGRKGKEKDINLAVGKLLGQYISAEHPNVKIVYTRNKDIFIGLKERSEIANKSNANLFISIHTNAVSKNSGVKGAEVYTFGLLSTNENFEVVKRENSVILLEDNYEQKYEGFDPASSESYIMFEFMSNKYAEQSVNFASLVQKELTKTAKRYDRGVKQAAYLVLRESTMPRILVELDFISNPEAENYLLSKTGQNVLARSICNAFNKYKKDFDRRTDAVLPDLTASNKEETPVKVETEKKVREDVKTEKQAEETVSPQKESDSGKKVYKVQILASTKKIPEKSPELKGYKVDFYVEKNWYKYTYGESSDRNEIENIRKKITKDFKGAFIITFVDGVKVPNK